MTMDSFRFYFLLLFWLCLFVLVAFDLVCYFSQWFRPVQLNRFVLMSLKSIRWAALFFFGCMAVLTFFLSISQIDYTLLKISFVFSAVFIIFFCGHQHENS